MSKRRPKVARLRGSVSEHVPTRPVPPLVVEHVHVPLVKGPRLATRPHMVWPMPPPPFGGCGANSGGYGGGMGGGGESGGSGGMGSVTGGLGDGGGCGDGGGQMRPSQLRSQLPSQEKGPMSQLLSHQLSHDVAWQPEDCSARPSKKWPSMKRPSAKTGVASSSLSKNDAGGNDQPGIAARRRDMSSRGLLSQVERRSRRRLQPVDDRGTAKGTARRSGEFTRSFGAPRRAPVRQFVVPNI